MPDNPANRHLDKRQRAREITASRPPPTSFPLDAAVNAAQPRKRGRRDRAARPGRCAAAIRRARVVLTRSLARRAGRSGPRAERRAPAAGARPARERRAARGPGRPDRGRGCRAARGASPARGRARRKARAPLASPAQLAAGPRARSRSRGLALQVRHFLGLGVRTLVRLSQLVLGLSLALLARALPAQRGIVGQVPGRLLEAAADLVENAHAPGLPQRRLA